MSNYSCRFKDGEYVFYKGNALFRSPVKGFVVKTKYEKLARRMLADLNKYGESHYLPSNIFSFFYTLSDMAEPHGLEFFLANAKITYIDDDDWYAFYGVKDGKQQLLRSVEWSHVKSAIVDWLSKLTLMQLVAVCTVAQSYESMYLAFCFACLAEEHDADTPEDKFLKTFAEFPVYQFCSSREEFFLDFKTFELFYSFHLKENGKTIEKQGDEYVIL